MRHVHRFVNEKQLDVKTPGELVQALRYDNVIANCDLEFLSVHRDGALLHKWRKGAAGRHLIPLGRVGEF